MSTNSKIQRSVIVARKREKELLLSVENYLEDRRANLLNLPHQIERIIRQEEERKQRAMEYEAWKKKVAEEESKKLAEMKHE